MPLRLLAVAFDVLEPAAVARFWGDLLHREIREDADGALLPGDDRAVGLRFVTPASGSSAASRLHLHVTTSSPADWRHTVETAVRLGGRHLDVGQLPDEDHVVLGGPGGQAFCVIGPDNRFLAGCGRLGEVTCDGSREVGVFWSAALGWPLVWDEGGETAIQSPRGGTKISWGGPPVAPRRGRNRERLVLTAPDVAEQVRRLVALGATRLGDRDADGVLADPDGNEFHVIGA